ncbi:MAG: hypothetical protein EA356_02075 [Geminicoccaceae bacterium]|nr:MAG: hypothetical protein EA356_02075 [Geminicoccaceae bacterium]
MDTHLAFQIRTFWIGLALTVAGTLLTLVLVGYVVLAFWFVWTLARVISGFLLLNRGEPIRGTEWFGAVAR